MSDREFRTLFCRNLTSEVTERLLYELFLQAGPLSAVRKPRGKPFAFIEFKHESAADYAMELFQGIRLFNRELTMHNRAKHQNNNANNQRSRPTRGYDQSNRSRRSFDPAPLTQMPQPSQQYIPQYTVPATAQLPQLPHQLQQQYQHNTSSYQQQQQQHHRGNSSSHRYHYSYSSHRHHYSATRHRHHYSYTRHRYHYHNSGSGGGKPYDRQGDRHDKHHRSSSRHTSGGHHHTIIPSTGEAGIEC